MRRKNSPWSRSPMLMGGSLRSPGMSRFPSYQPVAKVQPSTFRTTNAVPSDTVAGSLGIAASVLFQPRAFGRGSLHIRAREDEEKRQEQPILDSSLQTPKRGRASRFGGRGGRSFLRHGEIFRSDRGGRADAGRKAMRLCSPSHRLDEFPVGYCLAGCAPAEPASASPTGS